MCATLLFSHHLTNKTCCGSAEYVMLCSSWHVLATDGALAGAAAVAVAHMPAELLHPLEFMGTVTLQDAVLP